LEFVNRREAIKTTALLTVAHFATGNCLPQSIHDGRFEPLFSLPPLPYPADALEPYIDARTMEIHHDRHHAAYVSGLNSAVSQVPDFYFSLKSKGITEKTSPTSWQTWTLSLKGSARLSATMAAATIIIRFFGK
jgi:hypothetical protein